MRDQVRGAGADGYPAAALHSGVDHGRGAAVDRAALLEGELKPRARRAGARDDRGFKALVAELATAGASGRSRSTRPTASASGGTTSAPSTGRLRELRDVAPGVGMQAFTATATPRVREDIVRQLGLRDPEVLVGDVRPPEPGLPRARPASDAAEQIAEAILGDGVARGGRRDRLLPQRRKDTEKLAGAAARWARRRAYHAGMTSEKRRRRRGRFTNERLDVVVRHRRVRHGHRPPQRAPGRARDDAQERSRRTSRRPGAPGATGSPPSACCCTAPATPPSGAG
jgi:ATP-dependent DNA helicase RecQ